MKHFNRKGALRGSWKCYRRDAARNIPDGWDRLYTYAVISGIGKVC